MKSSVWIIGLVALWATGTANGQTTWYVDDDNCPGPGDGAQGNPFCLIQAGIDAAVDGDEVLVAEGEYFETIDLLGKAITVRGTDPSNPDIVAATIIDGAGLGTSGITCGSGEGADTIISGLTITGGNPELGGGMSNTNGSSPTVINCTFTDNHAVGGAARGGGMYNDASNPTVTNCTFSSNEADYLGGGMYNDNSNPTVTDCTFSGNDGSPGGGGMYNTNGSSPTVTDCTFSGNDATGGGGMNNVDSSPTVTGCTFSENTATSGGGMNNNYSDPTVTNCTFIGNGSTGGGGMNNNYSAPTVTNCTFSGNWATAGGGMNNNYSDPALTNCTFTGNWSTNAGAMNNYQSNPTLTNCILWADFYVAVGGGQNELFNISSAPIVSFSNVEGGLPGGTIDGGGNIDAEPLFVDPGYRDDNGTPGYFDDDFWVEGDYHLLPGSPVIDAAANEAVPKGVTTDRDGNPRFVDDPKTKDTGSGKAPIVDMGAYEFQVVSCTWDLDDDDNVGTGDLIVLLGSWGDPYGTADLIELLGNWGPCP